MSSTDQNTPGGKSGRRGRKTPRNPKAKQAQSPQADQAKAAEEPIVSTSEPAETPPIEAAENPQSQPRSKRRQWRKPRSKRPRRQKPLRSIWRRQRTLLRLLAPAHGGHRPGRCQRGARNRPGQPADHRECLWRLHQAIAGGDPVFCRKAKGRQVARQGRGGADRIRPPCFRDFRRGVAEDLRAPQGARQTDVEAAGASDEQAEPRPALDRKHASRFPVQMGGRQRLRLFRSLF